MIWLSWQKVIDNILGAKGRVVILGRTDVGKTTFAIHLIQAGVNSGEVVAFVDGDIGQSIVGPPGTIGLALLTHCPSDFDYIEPIYMKFVGSTSPVGHLLQTLSAIKKVVDKAEDFNPDVTVVDTTGFVEGDIARELKYRKLELISPKHIVAILTGEELDAIIKPFESSSEILIHRLKPPIGIRIKTQNQRERNRHRRFCRYFKDARSVSLYLRDYGLYGMVPELIWQIYRCKGASSLTSDLKMLEGRLVALCNKDQDVLALGVIEEVDVVSAVLRIKTILHNLKEVRAIQFGSMRIDIDIMRFFLL